MWQGLESTPAITRLYLRTLLVWGRGQVLIEAVLVGAFLGWMDPQAIAALDTVAYSNVRERVGEAAVTYSAPEHIRSGLADWETAALGRHLESGDRLVITSAGCGREVLGALSMGLSATGFEPNPQLRAAGAAVLREEGHPGALQACERDAFPDAASEVDAVLVGWASFSHITPRAKRVAFLRDARARLQPGAPLILSFWMLPDQGRRLGVIFRVAQVVRWLRRLEPPERGDLLRPHFLHAFTAPEIHDELAAASFGEVDFHTEPYPHAIALAG